MGLTARRPGRRIHRPGSPFTLGIDKAIVATASDVGQDPPGYPPESVLRLHLQRAGHSAGTLDLLNQVTAGAVMAMSSVSVVSNSPLSKNWKPHKD